MSDRNLYRMLAALTVLGGGCLTGLFFTDGNLQIAMYFGWLASWGMVGAIVLVGFGPILGARLITAIDNRCDPARAKRS